MDQKNSEVIKRLDVIEIDDDSRKEGEPASTRKETSAGINDEASTPEKQKVYNNEFPKLPGHPMARKTTTQSSSQPGMDVREGTPPIESELKTYDILFREGDGVEGMKSGERRKTDSKTKDGGKRL